jgi:SHS2 domain-containing protein
MGMTATGDHWQHFPHDADIGVRGVGASRERAFEQAALALTAAITDPATVNPRTEVSVQCAAPDDETLLVDWLNALVFEMARRSMLFGRFAVRLEGTSLSASAWGEPIDPARHSPAVEVKGATMTALAVRQGPDGRWLAQCVIDV